MARFYKIIVNAAICRLCGGFIESKARNDFVRCKCGAIFVDGGHDYIRRGTALPNASIDDIVDASHIEAAEGWA